MEHLDFASDFTFLHEEEVFEEVVVLSNASSSLLIKENVSSFILVAEEAYSLVPGQGVVRQYLAWAAGGERLLGDVRVKPINYNNS